MLYLVAGLIVMEKNCVICNKIFTPTKYRPQAQEVCSDPVCQHKRQLENMKRWRRNNPHYFRQDEIRGVYWRELYRRRIRRWRKEHPEYFKKYRDRYKAQHREYMREYMRRYRNVKKRMLQQAEPQPPISDILS
ncbi:MAG: hypothetical protein COW11_05670 [Candidatus Omnitrophica bacterium CG12_big_fil_rev_8_21_14_0_65_43_15]|uniref:Uncharacterized protein n=1 Tax=Candidatus Taenaricola geysiri TaxID=1974752 RepID=A0A2J0LMS5_9BACT|nr:MAG: hypothetical protein AUJ89_01520 [Candidatus Omnitrophica bacterium CG1_02_43_210]PIV11998.1 MAG: hypothetical protein COS48_03250 [Candidatus Omnitrophica bacterium CG03_land_8_20_14_0_80_43_22]PIW66016.1 MAG: hypothetical protein COW11_05670 [Candidatus Omnitrophica bacterium CG12_big_fil_rev_8_21_14_0_65_43_15]PIW80872.1 MAG: hypothetical protein COZ98_00295 [Candidatus Omnitrophica bacterium CG_4_8_14_3_um_filter_43_15]PJC46342.1 MAG: hypothetical protein CO036_03145 [Candidatus Omn